MARAIALLAFVACGDGIEPPADAAPDDPDPRTHQLAGLRCSSGSDQLDLTGEALARTPVATLEIETVEPHRTEIRFRYEGAGCLAVERWVYFDLVLEAREREMLACEPVGCLLDPDDEPCVTGPKPDRAPLLVEVVLDEPDTLLEFGPGYPGLCARRGFEREVQTWRRR